MADRTSVTGSDVELVGERDDEEGRKPGSQRSIYTGAVGFLGRQDATLPKSGKGPAVIGNRCM